MTLMPECSARNRAAVSSVEATTTAGRCSRTMRSHTIGNSVLPGRRLARG